MELTTHILRSLIQEEVFATLQEQERITPDAAAQNLATTLARYEGAGLNIDNLFSEAKKIMGSQSPFNRKDERKLTAPEREKREEVAQAMEEEDPSIDMGKKMAIATAQAKKSA